MHHRKACDAQPVCRSTAAMRTACDDWHTVALPTMLTLTEAAATCAHQGMPDDHQRTGAFTSHAGIITPRVQRQVAEHG